MAVGADSADIQECNFTVQLVRGTDNSLADALSRTGYGNDKKTDKDIADKECQTDQAVTAPIRMVEDARKSGEQTMDLKTWQQADRDTSKVMMWMNKEEHPPPQAVRHPQFSSKGFVHIVILTARILNWILSLLHYI